MDALTKNVITGIEELTQQSIAETFVLYQNYPNPFNPVTQIDFQLPNTSGVKLEVYDIAGRRVKILLKKRLMVGHHTVKWDGTSIMIVA